MIEMKISGHSPLGKKETRKFIEWMAHEFRIDDYKKPIFVDVCFKKNLLLEEGAKGFFVAEDSSPRPREFSIEIDGGMCAGLTYQTLSHEMIHVWQQATGRWQETSDPYKNRWEKKVLDISTLDYENYPWEREAYALEDAYVSKYRNMKGKL